MTAENATQQTPVAQPGEVTQMQEDRAPRRGVDDDFIRTLTELLQRAGHQDWMPRAAADPTPEFLAAVESYNRTVLWLATPTEGRPLPAAQRWNLPEANKTAVAAGRYPC